MAQNNVNPSVPPRSMSQISEEEKAYHDGGYARLAAWMAASPDLFILRRYSPLAARSLLYLQHQIYLVDAELKRLDDAHFSQKPVGEAGADSFGRDPNPRREELIKDAVTRLKEYYDLINSFAQIKAIPTARDHHIRNLDIWLANNENAIAADERHFREHPGDLFPVIPRSKSLIRQFMEQWRWLTLRFALAQKPERTERVELEHADYLSDTGFEIFVSGFVVVLGLCLLFAPMWWLNFVSNSDYRLAIITVFVTLFAGCLWVTAGQRPFEVLGATAAYAAVLLVYLQSNAQSKLPKG